MKTGWWLSSFTRITIDRMPKTKSAELPDRIVAVWKRHDDILLLMLRAISQEGLAALPTASRGRDVGRVFFHLDRVRRAWLQFLATGKRPSLPRADKGPPPKKAALVAALRESGREVEEFLAKALAGEARVQMFGGDPLRWLGYLIAHESHHRGQIAIALKQSGVRLPEKIALGGLWGSWISGK